MKITQIRGENIASLARFELDLEDPLIDAYGLFAITGETGSGKSSILDALCLALFDKTPRLTLAKDAQSQDQGLGLTDSRHLLQRGASEAMAEVGFIGVDHKRYLARWELHRAKKKVDGNLQKVKMSLREADSGMELASHRKPETLKLIESKLGLSFEEFRKAVLLAQGDFAAFLDAAPGDRAALLERMTGTEIYSEVAKRAYARKKEEEAAVRRLEDQAEGFTPRSPEHIAGLQAELLESEPRIQRQKHAISLCRARIEALESLKAKQKACEVAEQAQKDSETAWEALKAKREAAAQKEAAEACRPSLQAETQAREVRKRAEAALKQANADLEQQAKEQKAADAHQSEIAIQHAALKQKHHALLPELERAKALDLRIQKATEARDAEAERLGKIQSAQAEIREQRRRDQAEREALEASLKAPAMRRLKDPELRALLEAFDTEAKLDQLKALLPRLQQAREAEAEAQSETQKAKATLRALQSAETEKQTALSQAEAELEAASSTRVSPNDAAQSQALETWLSDEVAQLSAFLGAPDAEAAGLTRLQGLDAELLASEDAIRAHQVGIQALSDALELEQQRLLKRDVVQQLEAHRDALLVEGEPCPLCGSRTHARDQLKPLAALDDASLSIKQARAQRKAQLDQAQSTRESLISAHAKASSEHRARIEARQRFCEHWTEVQKRLEALPLTSGAQIGPPEDEASWHQLNLLLQAVSEQNAQIRAQNSAYEACQRAQTIAQAALIRIQSEKSAAQSRLQKLEATREQRADAFKETRAEVQALEQHLAPLTQTPESIQSLEAVLGLERALAELQARWQRQHSEEARLADIQDHLAELRGQESTQNEAESKSRGRLTELEANEAKEKAERAPLLSGRPSRAVEDEMKAEQDTQSAAAEKAKRRLDTSHEVFKAKEAQTRLRETEAEHAKAAHLEAEAAFAEALEASPWTDRDALQSWLSEDREITRARKAELEDADKTREACRSKAAWERQGAREQREKLGSQDALAAFLVFVKPPFSPANADDLGGPARIQEEQDQLERLQREIEEQHKKQLIAIHEAERQLKAEAEITAKIAEVHGRLLEQETEAWRWTALSEAIGSADGKRFRDFAQQYTLNRLIDEANLHLERLRPRYRLREVAEQAMGLQVEDQEQGGLRRTIAGLSGGERFLMALALALALSSMSSQKVELRSLFIDEGFGALDPQSLEATLACLETLRTEGRVIGLISHVPALAEWIPVQVRVQKQRHGKSRVKPPQLRSVTEGAPAFQSSPARQTNNTKDQP